jgi:hypothetical protein
MVALLFSGACSVQDTDKTSELVLDKLRQMGARLHVDENLPNKPLAIDLKSSKNADQILAVLKDLARTREIRALDLELSSVTGEGMRVLASLDKLERLTLAHTGIDDGDLQPISQLVTLKLLRLNGTRITDEGISPDYSLSCQNRTDS